MNRKMMTPGPLLNDKGELIESGYSNVLCKKYERSRIKASKFRIKEWDYYYIGNNEYGIALTVADNSYMWMVSISVLDFVNSKEVTKSNIGLFSMGKLKLPSSSNVGNIEFRKKNFYFKFTRDSSRRLEVFYKNFDKGDFYCDVILNETSENSIVVATPFNKPKHFYYNQKINNLLAKGYFTYQKKEYSLDNAYAVLDWGRGVWTYKNTWYWSSFSGICDGKLVGFNLGYGFGNNTDTENMVFVDDEYYKLDDVEFIIPKRNNQEKYLEQWLIRSESGNIHLIFEPILDRFADTNLLILRSLQHQVFGKFTGYIKTNDQVIVIDHMVGFAEKVYNKW